jgi:hypothetical protein
MIRRRSSTRPAGTSTCNNATDGIVPNHLATACVTTTTTACCPPENNEQQQQHNSTRSNRRSFLVGCSKTGHIYVWKIPVLSEDGSTLLEYDANPFLEFTVVGKSRRQEDHQETCCLYALKFINLDGINDLLLVSGDGGIYFFQLKTWLRIYEKWTIRRPA